VVEISEELVSPLRKRLLVSAASLSIVCGVLPAVVIAAPGAGAAVATPEVDEFEVDFDWELTQFLEIGDPRPLIQAGATRALASGDHAMAKRFIAVDYPYLVDEAARMAQFDREWCDLVLEYVTAEDGPAVYVAARAACYGSDEDRATFVRTGYAEAQQRDLEGRAREEQAARALVEADREFVRILAQTAPGEQVRVSAAFATRPMAGDRDLAEFFEYGWLSGSRLDFEAYRRRNAENEVMWRRRLARLVADANAAEAAARNAAAEVADQLRAAAARAWHTVGEQAGPPRTAWQDAQRVAEAQAQHWAQVAEAAANGTAGPSSAAIAAPAASNQSGWNDEGTLAGEQAASWQALLDEAVERELRLSPG
jgi:hypothetical protein